MIASTSSNDNCNCTNHTGEYHDSHHSHQSILLLPTDDKLKERNKCETDESDSESDAFGDFETAAQTEADESEVVNRDRDQRPMEEDLSLSLPCSSSCPQMKPSPFDMQIARLLDEAVQMNCSDCETEFDRILLSHCQPTADSLMANIFSVLDTDSDCTDESELDQVEGLALKSFRLWQQINRFHEMRILNFQWDNAHGREMLLNALSLRKLLFKAADFSIGRSNRANLPFSGANASRVQF